MRKKAARTRLLLGLLVATFMMFGMSFALFMTEAPAQGTAKDFGNSTRTLPPVPAETMYDEPIGPEQPDTFPHEPSHMVPATHPPTTAKRVLKLPT